MPPWKPRKIDKLHLGSFRLPPRGQIGRFLREWFTAVRGDGVAFIRADVATAGKRAWIDTYGEPTYEECRRAWDTQFIDRVNHALRDGCGMAFPDLSRGKYMVRKEFAEPTLLMLIAAEKASAGRLDVEAASTELEQTLLARDVPAATVAQMLQTFRQFAGL